MEQFNSELFVQLMMAVVTMLTAFFAWRASVTAQAAKQVATETQAIAQKTEINTNSMKDALVEATEKLAHAQGLAQGKLEQKAEHSDIQDKAIQANTDERLKAGDVHVKTAIVDKLEVKNIPDKAI